MWNNILKRLKSPVVIVQLITILATAVVVIVPEIEPQVKAVVAAVTAVYNIFAGLNNPTDKDNF